MYKWATVVEIKDQTLFKCKVSICIILSVIEEIAKARLDSQKMKGNILKEYDEVLIEFHFLRKKQITISEKEYGNYWSQPKRTTKKIGKK